MVPGLEPGFIPTKTQTMDIAVSKFDASRANEYERQCRIGLAGYDACHELAACVLSSHLGAGSTRHVLVVGAGGTAQEVQVAAALEPSWRFTAVDPSRPMLEQAAARIHALGLGDRTQFVLGKVEDLPAQADFDAATLIGVLHHLPGTEAKRSILSAIAERLPHGAPFVIAGNSTAYASEPVLMGAWAQRWRMFGASNEEAQQKMGRILEAAAPPASEQELLALLEQAGFSGAKRFFSSLFWSAWITYRS